MAKAAMKRTQVAIELPRSDSAEVSAVPLLTSSTLSPSSPYTSLEGKLDDLDKRSLRLHTSASQYSRTESPYISSTDDRSMREPGYKRTVLQQKMSTFHSALGEELKMNEELDRENGRLRREAEVMRKELTHLRALIDELDRSKSDLEARNIELNAHLSQAQSSLSDLRHSSLRLLSPLQEEELLQHVTFMTNKLEDVPELQLLVRGRISGMREYKGMIEDGEYGPALLKSLQVITDFLVFCGSRRTGKWKEVTRRAELDAERDTARNTGTQTMTEKSVGTHHVHSPSFTQESLRYSESRLRTSSTDPHSHFSPPQPPATLEDPQPSIQPDLTDRLSKLHQQIYETMASSKRLLSTPSKTRLLQSLRSVVSSPSLIGARDSMTPYGVRIQLVKDEPSDLTEKIRKAELSMKEEDMHPEDESLLKPEDPVPPKGRTRSPAVSGSRQARGKAALATGKKPWNGMRGEVRN